METTSKIDKIVSQVAEFLASLCITILAGLFALMTICALVQSIIEPSIINVIGCVACAAGACMFWSVRRGF